MAYQGNQSSGGQAPQNRPQLPSIHNLNTSYYPGFPPMQQPSGGYSEHPSGRQAAPFSSLPNMASSAEGYGRPTAPGSSWSDGPAQSPMGQTPPETGQPSPAATSGSGGQPGTSQPAKGASGGSEFVKKLFNMLEDGMHNHIVSWGPRGDSFIVKDMNEFTKSILPKHFKHSNFASFVRQLNKYDFHKVKNPESGQDGQSGEQQWEFKHPNFRADMKASLEQIKRKGPAPRKTGAAAAKQDTSAPHESCERVLAMFQQQLDGFAQDQHNLRAHVSNLTRDYQALIGEVQNFRRTFASHDHLIQNLINVCARHERPPPGQSNNEEEAHQTQELQSLISAYNESARASHNQLDQISESRPSLVSGRLLSGNRPSPSPRIGEASIAQSQPEHQHFPQHERPQQQQQQQHIPRQQPIQQPQQPQGQTVPPGRSGGTQPNWSVRPKVLLVEDDPISRKLSSKFLEVLGCSIEVAEDGVNAVNKMNSEKFDLVFMDINMPHLDGVSATSLIRQFDPMTPIISMTSNSNPNQVLTYFSHGMNDILPKPFTKEGLLSMLEKHLLHLKQMQQLTEIPRALGIPDDAIESALVSTFVDPSANNPFADMVADFGLSEDPDYVNMLASLVNGGNNGGPGPPPPSNGQDQGQMDQQQQTYPDGYRKREMDSADMDGGQVHKRGRYSDVI